MAGVAWSPARVTLDAELSSSDGVALAHNRWRTTLFPSFKDGPGTDFGIKLWSSVHFPREVDGAQEHGGVRGQGEVVQFMDPE